MIRFSDFLDSVDQDKLQYDILDVGLGGMDVNKCLEGFTQDQISVMVKLSHGITISYLRQYHEFLLSHSSDDI